MRPCSSPCFSLLSLKHCCLLPQAWSLLLTLYRQQRAPSHPGQSQRAVPWGQSTTLGAAPEVWEMSQEPNVAVQEPNVAVGNCSQVDLSRHGVPREEKQAEPVTVRSLEHSGWVWRFCTPSLTPFIQSRAHSTLSSPTPALFGHLFRCLHSFYLRSIQPRTSVFFLSSFSLLFLGENKVRNTKLRR